MFARFSPLLLVLPACAAPDAPTTAPPVRAEPVAEAQVGILGPECIMEEGLYRYTAWAETGAALAHFQWTLSGLGHTRQVGSGRAVQLRVAAGVYDASLELRAGGDGLQGHATKVLRVRIPAGPPAGAVAVAAAPTPCEPADSALIP